MAQDFKKASLHVQGLDQIEKGLSNLAAWAEKDVLKKACKEAAEIIADEARALVPEKTGRLKRAIRVRAGKARGGSISYLATVGKRWFAGDSFYGAFQEFGWHVGKRKSFAKGQKGQSQGRRKVEGEHYMEYAFDNVASNAMSVFVAAVKRGIAAELEKK